MKKRLGFVSNSSSSSFICEICGHDESGWDMTLEDAKMYECKGGHTICEDHVEEGDVYSKESIIKILKANISYCKKRTSTCETRDKDYYVNNEKDAQKELDKVLTLDLKDLNHEDELWYDELIENCDIRSSIPKKFCPICKLEFITKEDLLSYHLQKHNEKLLDVENEIKNKFYDLDELQRYLKGDVNEKA